MKIGLLGGTFDPIHNGHIAAARAAADLIGLDFVLLIPAGNPQHRKTPPIATAQQRYEMVTVACCEAADERLQPSSVDIDRPGATYTIDMLSDVRAQFPDAQFYLILGADAAAALDTWWQPEAIREQVQLVVVDRMHDSNRVGESMAEQSAFQRALHIPLADFDVSATAVRTAVAAGKSIADLVPNAVAAYIAANGLYR